MLLWCGAARLCTVGTTLSGVGCLVALVRRCAPAGLCPGPQPAGRGAPTLLDTPPRRGLRHPELRPLPRTIGSSERQRSRDSRDTLGRDASHWAPTAPRPETALGVPKASA